MLKPQGSLRNLYKVPVAKFKPRSSDLRHFPFTYSQIELFIFGSQTCLQILITLVLPKKRSCCCLWEPGNILEKKERGLTFVSWVEKRMEGQYTELKEHEHSPEMRKCKTGSGEMQEPGRRVERKEDHRRPAVTSHSVARGLKQQHTVLTFTVPKHRSPKPVSPCRPIAPIRPGLEGNKGSIPLFLPLGIKCLP